MEVCHPSYFDAQHAAIEIPATTDALEEIGAEIKRLQALYEFGKAVQLSLFGDASMAAQLPRKRRK
ncbi:hypothetical protein ANAEL_02058 [Anaerolineales bacterium]|nr:hypothetical protein ANAEL_02058 [Anaerolineales bacterium]